MVQRKVLSKLGIQADHVERDMRFSNRKLPSSGQRQDCGESKGVDMKNSKPIKLSDSEALQSPPPPKRRSLSQQAKALPGSLQQHKPLVRTINGSPNYMKATSSSDAKMELFPVSLRNTQSGKNLPQICSTSSKASFSSCKKPENSLTRLTKTPTFKPSRTSPRKSTTAVLSVDMNPVVRATCSSTLKDSKFPAYLMLNPEGAEFEGASVIDVCPYKYCSLNGHHHAPLPPLNSFMSASRRLLKTQKSMKLETPSPRRLKVLDGKHAHDEADMTGNPIITPLAQEIGIDFFIEIYANKNQGAGGTRRFESAEEGLEGQDNIKSETDENDVAAEDYGVEQVTPAVTCALPKCEAELEEDLKIYFDEAAIDADTKGSFHPEQNAEDADESRPPSRFRKEICMESYCSEVSYDEEYMENIELDGSDSQHENVDSSVFTDEETDSNFEPLSESSHDVSVMRLDDIVSSHHADIMVEESLQEANGEENTCFEAQPNDANSVLEGTSESMEFETQDAEDIGKQNGKYGEYEAGSTTKVLDDEETASSTAKVLDDEETVGNKQGHKMSETSELDEGHIESNTIIEHNDGGIISQENRIHASDALDESNIVVRDQELLEEDQVKASKFQSTSCIGVEYQNTSKNWQRGTRRKRPVQDDEETRKINPRKPNFLPLVPEPEPEKVNLKHHTTDERKNSEEWMIDFALRQAVTQLAPTGKRKVALLVEAYETVMPAIPKWESHMRNSSPFAHARPIQACS